MAGDLLRSDGFASGLSLQRRAADNNDPSANITPRPFPAGVFSSSGASYLTAEAERTHPFRETIQFSHRRITRPPVAVLGHMHPDNISALCPPI